MAQSPIPTLRFQIFRGNDLLGETSFTEVSITIGRAANALLRVDDASVGELHAVINVEDDGTVQLLDLGTEAGTLLRGQRVANAELSSGDSFDLGGIRLLVSFEETERTTPTMDARPGSAGHTIIAPDDIPGEFDDEDLLTRLLREGANQAGTNTKAAKVLSVSHIWGDALLDSRQFERSHPVTIGPSFGHKWTLLGVPMGWVPESSAGILRMSPPIWSDVNEVWSSDFYVTTDNLPNNDDHVLFRPDGNGWIAVLDGRWDGFIDEGNQRIPLSQAVASGRARQNGNLIEVPMKDDAALAVDIQGVIFLARLTHPTAKAVGSEAPDYVFLTIGSMCAFLGVLFALVMFFSPPEPRAASNEVDERFVEMLLEKVEPPPEEKKAQDEKKNEDAGEGAKAKEEEGKVGRKESKLEQAKGEKVNSAIQDREIAENAGVLGAMNDPNSPLNAGLDAGLSSGIGGLIGMKGTQMGAGGLGARGGGLGGGGTADGLGGLGTKGSGLGGSGTGKGAGEFGSGGGLGSKSTKSPSAGTGEPIVLGALDPALIDKVVKSKMSQIRYCYTRELQKNPSLAGKLTIKFTISKDGSVSAASVKSSTVGSPAVDQCVVQRFYQMQFPEPKGGGIVSVSYPFIFSPG